MSKSFQHIKEISSGGAATSPKDLETRFHRHVAIKTVQPESTINSDLFKEAILIARLHHPPVVSVYDVGVRERGTPTDVMEFLKEATTCKILEKGQMGLVEFSQISEQALNEKFSNFQLPSTFNFIVTKAQRDDDFMKCF